MCAICWKHEVNDRVSKLKITEIIHSTTFITSTWLRHFEMHFNHIEKIFTFMENLPKRYTTPIQTQTATLLQKNRKVTTNYAQYKRRTFLCFNNWISKYRLTEIGLAKDLYIALSKYSEPHLMTMTDSFAFRLALICQKY